MGYTTTGLSNKQPNFALGWDSATAVTINSCSLQTYVYKVYRTPTDSIFVPTAPQSVTFGYTVLGERVLSAATEFNATLQAGSPNRIKTSWKDCNPNEEGFRLYRKASGAASYTDTVVFPPFNPSNCGSAVDSFLDTNIMGSETYIYKLQVWTRNQPVYTDSAKVKNIPNKPVQANPGALSNMNCCRIMAPGGCNPKTNRVAVKWYKPQNQKLNSLTKYKIKVKRGGGTVFWFTHNDVSQDTVRDTLCLWDNYTCSLWVYAYDAIDSSNASNPKVVLVGPCRVCNPPLDYKIAPPFEVSEAVQQPKEFSLSQNYPNPFNPTTQISYALPQNADVEMTIYNILGRKIRKFSLGYQTAGYKTVSWDGKDNAGNEVASGIYFYRIVAGDFTQTKKMTLLK